MGVYIFTLLGSNKTVDVEQKAFAVLKRTQGNFYVFAQISVGYPGVNVCMCTCVGSRDQPIMPA